MTEFLKKAAEIARVQKAQTGQQIKALHIINYRAQQLITTKETCPQLCRHKAVRNPETGHFTDIEYSAFETVIVGEINKLIQAYAYAAGQLGVENYVDWYSEWGTSHYFLHVIIMLQNNLDPNVTDISDIDRDFPSHVDHQREQWKEFLIDRSLKMARELAEGHEQCTVKKL